MPIAGWKSASRLHTITATAHRMMKATREDLRWRREIPALAARRPRPALPGGAPLTVSRVLALQRTHGNAYVSRLIARQPANAPAPPAPAPAKDGAGPAGSDPQADATAAVEQMMAALAEHKAAAKAIEGKKKPSRAERKAVSDAMAKHQAAVVVISKYLRNRLPDKELLDRYLDRHDVAQTEKVETVGQVAAEVARMEFLLGTLHNMGTEAKWEDKDAKGKTHNKGAFVSEYQKAVGGDDEAPWCTKFAGYAYSRLGFTAAKGSTDMSMFHSGYRLGEWGKTGKGVGDKPKQITAADKTVKQEAGGSALIDSKAWAKLKKDLKAKKTTEDRKKVAEEFFTQHPAPQAGDIIVKPRGTDKDNAFSGGGKSHTMLVDRYDAASFTVFTVEGNAGDKVGSRMLDLTDPDTVGAIITLTRLGTEYFGDREPRILSPEQTEPAGSLKPSRFALLAPMQLVNALLVKLNHAQGFIKSGDAGATVYEWIHGDTKATAGSVKES